MEMLKGPPLPVIGPKQEPAFGLNTGWKTSTVETVLLKLVTIRFVIPSVPSSVPVPKWTSLTVTPVWPKKGLLGKTISTTAALMAADTLGAKAALQANNPTKHPAVQRRFFFRCILSLSLSLSLYQENFEFRHGPTRLAWTS